MKAIAIAALAHLWLGVAGIAQAPLLRSSQVPRQPAQLLQQLPVLDQQTQEQQHQQVQALPEQHHVIFTERQKQQLHELQHPRADGEVALLQRGTSARVTVRAEAEAEMQLDSQCFDVANTLCVEDESGRSFTMERSFFPPDLRLWYQFDERLPVDHSGNLKHLTDDEGKLTKLTVGPGIMGRGNSASFDGRSFRTVQDTKALNTPAFTVALWLFLREDSVGAWRVIFSRGSSVEELLPALLLWPDERRLHVRVSPKADAGVGAQLDSAGVIPLKRWTHLAVSCTGNVLRLYINGVQDAQMIVEETPEASEKSTLKIGRDPWRAGVKGFIDDFRWYSRGLARDEVSAMLYPGLTGNAASTAVSLACLSCRYPEAVRKCNNQRRYLCSMQELFAGGLHTARSSGWLSSSSEVWSSEDEGDQRFDGRVRLGLCCDA